MGTEGYRYAERVDYRPGEVILEVGSGPSTDHLAQIGPLVVTIDVDRHAYEVAATIPNVEAHLGLAEEILRGWDRPVGFAWLDGHDWPYSGFSLDDYAWQWPAYHERGQSYSQEASRRSHLEVAELSVEYARVVAVDDTWKTHAWRTDGDDLCAESVPPATPPAPMLNMMQGTGTATCRLERTHPHHDDPSRGWNGKGGDAVPMLLKHGFRVLEHGLCLVVLERGETFT